MIKLIPRKDKDGNDSFEQPDFMEGLNDWKNIFGDHYDVQELEWGKLQKIKRRFWILIQNGVEILTEMINGNIIIIFQLQIG